MYRGEEQRRCAAAVAESMSADERAAVGVYELDPDQVKVSEDNLDWSRWVLRADPTAIGSQLSRALLSSQLRMGGSAER
jgi:hypothetical protein